ncbi:hypothetical protein [Pseudomonas fulva]|nr:hypothetical protein [Pseudomonas fulva]MBF8779473.1 hypothetical protein [Pseudomonas fulva]
MTSFWNLLRRPRPLTYALVDANGLCQAFRQSTQPPAGPSWVQVREAYLGWLGHPLPVSAKVCDSANGRWQQRSLPA